MDFLKSTYNVIISNPILSSLVSGVILAIVFWIFRNYIKKFFIFIFKWFLNGIVKIPSKSFQFIKWLWGKVQRLITTISGSNNKIVALENRITELEKEKRRNFIRNQYFFNIELKHLDPQTLNVMTKIEAEKGLDKAIPYLDEFYKRMSRQKFFEWWLTLLPEQKEAEFRKMMNQIDGGWGEVYFKEEKKVKG